MINRRHLIGAAAGTLAWGTPAFADVYPSKPIRFINPYQAGSNGDVAPRIVLDKATLALGQPFVIENRVGASGLLAMRMLAQARNDGYIIGLGTTATLITAPLTTTNPGFADADIDPITPICDVPFAVSVTNDLPVKTVQELIAYGRANPGKLSYASDGNGTTTHLATEMLLQAAGVTAVHVPYKGGAGSYTTDFVSGRIHFAIGGIGVPLSLHRAGKLRIIGVTSKSRVSVLPDMGTVAEQGFPGFEATSLFGIFGPRGMPAEAVDRLGLELRRAVESKDVSDKLLASGFTPVTATPSDFRKQFALDRVKWAEVARKANVQKVAI
ncbi:MAG: tripartite tricarboxylate transporter substrate binding protein [Burkholderiaceae bacterium]|nr:tripartite tricarboxylate transporter substrate binding protein [Burkholderiaceae bacterium]